jgi:hypothetical protein
MSSKPKSSPTPANFNYALETYDYADVFLLLGLGQQLLRDCGIEQGISERLPARRIKVGLQIELEREFERGERSDDGELAGLDQIDVSSGIAHLVHKTVFDVVLLVKKVVELGQTDPRPRRKYWYPLQEVNGLVQDLLLDCF